jgi:hypothetical protein
MINNFASVTDTGKSSFVGIIDIGDACIAGV